MSTEAIGTERIECGGVHCTNETLLEIDSGHVMVRVERQGIRRAALRHGTISPHPVLQVLFGVALTALAYFPFVHLLHWLRHGGTFFAFEAWLIPLPVAGVWLVVHALQRGFFIEVEHEQGTKRLAFHRSAPPDEIRAFVDEVERRYDIKILRQT